MADASSQAQALVRELATANYDADDLPNLARNVYVRCLLKVHAVGGRTNAAKSVALTVTANVLKQLVGMHFGAPDVQKLLDEQEGVAPAAADQAGKPPPKPIDPYDLGM
jgi:hypothetical protein